MITLIKQLRKNENREGGRGKDIKHTHRVLKYPKLQTQTLHTRLEFKILTHTGRERENGF